MLLPGTGLGVEGGREMPRAWCQCAACEARWTTAPRVGAFLGGVYSVHKGQRSPDLQHLALALDVQEVASV